MILPLITGYIVGRFVTKRSLAIAAGVLLGALLGLIAIYTFIPLLYPLFAGITGEVGIPEFDSIGIMFVLQEIVIYSESIYFLSRSLIIDFVFILTGVVFAILGTWYGLTRKTIRITTPFVNSEIE